MSYNGKEIKTFPGAFALFETQELTAPDGSLIHLRFMKDTVDFEVFLNGQQIDNSETSPKRVIANLKWPIYISLSWYALVLVVCYFTVPGIYAIIADSPGLLIEDFFVIYFVTSSLLAVATLFLALFLLNKGSLLVYHAAVVVIALDLLFGIAYRLPELIFGSGGFLVVLFFNLLFPVSAKSAMLWAFITNGRKYRQYVLQKKLEKPKINHDLVDV